MDQPSRAKRSVKNQVENRMKRLNGAIDHMMEALVSADILFPGEGYNDLATVLETAQAMMHGAKPKDVVDFSGVKARPWRMKATNMGRESGGAGPENTH